MTPGFASRLTGGVNQYIILASLPLIFLSCDLSSLFLIVCLPSEHVLHDSLQFSALLKLQNFISQLL